MLQVLREFWKKLGSPRASLVCGVATTIVIPSVAKRVAAYSCVRFTEHVAFRRTHSHYASRSKSHARAFKSKAIRGTLHSQSTLVEHVSVNHRRLKASVPQQFLDSANVATAFEQVRRERMTQCMTRYPLAQTARLRRRCHSSLNGSLVQMASPAHAGLALNVGA